MFGLRTCCMEFWLTSTQPAAFTSGLDLISSGGFGWRDTCSMSNGTVIRSPLWCSLTFSKVAIFPSPSTSVSATPAAQTLRVRAA